MKKWLLFLLFLMVSPVWAKVYVDITSPSSARIGIALRYDGLSVKAFRNTLERDLMVYGIFALYHPMEYGMTKEEVKVAGADLYVTLDSSVLGNNAKVAYTVEDLSDGSVVAEGVLSFEVSQAVGAAHKVADVIYKVVTGNDGMFERRAVAVRKVSGGYELVLVDVGAMKYKRVAFFKRPALSPALSPDGKRIVFSLMNEKKDFDLYLYDLENKTIRKVCSTLGPDTAPEWAPDGKGVYFSGYLSENNADILYCDIATGKVKPIVRGISIETSPTVSPDGKKMAFVSDREGSPHVYLLDLSTGLSYKISSGRYDVSPSWSPKGEEVVYASLVNGGFHISLYNVRSYTGRVLFPGKDPTWSPNGDYILYVRSDGLYISPVYGSSGSGLRLFVGKWLNPYWR